MNPEAVLDGLLRRLDDEHDGATLFGADWAEDWPSGLLDELLKGGLLQPAEPARLVRCPGCHDDHVEQVEYVSYPDGVRAFVRCPELGRAPVVPETLLRWRIDGGGLARATRGSLGLGGRLVEQVPGRVWRLGYGQFEEAAATVFFVRGLGWPHAAAVPAGRGLRMVLTAGDPSSTAPPDDMVIAGLPDLASWSHGTLSVDRAALEARMQAISMSRFPSQPDARGDIPTAVGTPTTPNRGGRPRLEDDPTVRQLYEEGERLRRAHPTITRAQIASRLGIPESTYKRYVMRLRRAP